MNKNIINILAIDVGNSYIKIGIINSCYKILSQTIFETKDFNCEFFEQKLKECIQHHSINGSIICSVVPHTTKSIYLVIKEIYNINSYLIDQENTKFNFEFDFPNKKSVGQDLLALAQYCSLQNKNCLGLSYGTAIAGIAIINNRLIGVTISPGITFSFEYLMKKIDLIEETQLNKYTNLDSGVTTPTSLESGINHFRNGFTYSFYNSIKKKYKVNDLIVVITGGEAKKVNLNAKQKINKNAILIGLIDIYLKNNI